MGLRVFSSAVLAACILFSAGCKSGQKSALFERWTQNVQSFHKEFDRTEAVVAYLDSQWSAVSFEVMGAHSLALSRTGKEELNWPYGNSTRPFGEQEEKARRVFKERFGLDAPPYFPPALKEYSFMAPPWAEPLNLGHWRKVLYAAKLESLDDVYQYLERRKTAKPSAAQIVELLSQYPGCAIEFFDQKRRYVVVRLANEFLRSGTDASVIADSDLVYDLCSVEGGTFIVKVADWGASMPNPVDIVVAKELADLGAAPEPTGPIRAKHQARIARLLRSRGITTD